MGKTVQVNLEDLRFYSYHGFYPEEQILGNEYFVNIKTFFDSSGLGDDQLEHTVNYEQLYSIATTAMKNPRKLLETVADEILENIKLEFQHLTRIEVSISKINPPFGGDRAQARVTIQWHKKD
ncbi:dihydroneopterin aldolase [Albibacterium bauzanense]|uniref:7,8-dihydroneopterin aldolase n=1 Tax=Albibacterium bauzanense TaxID=653929 RepID=A0A4R1LWY4_9SPHI|nr:dihydroneopterin aldolase [Albibacterium bauzanense]TCK83327.1 dihydroneopterin aldolase [Albibacterium bauzanense]